LKTYYFKYLLLSLISILVFVLVSTSSFAQEFSTESKRAIKLYQTAESNFNLLNYKEAELDLTKAIEIDNNFLEAYMLLGDVYRSTKDFEKAVEVYGRVADKDVSKYPEALYFSGLSYFELVDYQKALARFKKFQRYEKEGGRAEDAGFLKACCEFSIHAMKNPVPFEPVNLGAGINTPNHEYINSVKSDELQLYFTRRQIDNGSRGGGEDFFYTDRSLVADPWKTAIKLKPPINTSGDEGALFITPDAQFLIFAGCGRSGGYGSCDIYAAKILGETVTEPVNLGPDINTAAWETQPSLSADGRTLYFVSNRAGGFGQSDIWMSRLQDNGVWSDPKNLGETINTRGSEMAPYVHPDGQTMYFSSDGQVGLGGMDLFISKLDTSGSWSEPVNLGYPINSSGDEINIIVNAWGDKAYISSNMHEGFGGYDIFEFELPLVSRPVASTFMKGKVRDKETGRPLEAYFSLMDVNNGKEIVRSFSDVSTGEFLVCIPTNNEYALNVSAEGYLFYSENFSLEGLASEVEPFLLDLEMNPIRPGETMILRNIFFETDTYSLKETSFPELEKLIGFLNYNPGLKVEISGHTDTTGTEEYNFELSEERARSVKDYLIENGVETRQLVYKGYGATKPVAENDTEDGRALNRRTEIRILESD
jgi:outer membrane protein OmpA-like peptidoglycan-associated protein/tetratricopeptide (TPR) repeat protein